MSVRQHQIAGMAEKSDNGPGAGHEKITDNESDKKIAHFFKQYHPAIAHAEGIAGPTHKKTEPQIPHSGTVGR